MKKEDFKNGSKVWYIPDGWLPLKAKTKNVDLEGHEAVIILNCNNEDAEIFMDIFFEDKEPIENIKLNVKAKRVKCFRMDNPDDIGGVKIDRLYQYALRIRSNIEVIIQYGRMDVTQSNLSYIGTMAFTG